MPIHVCVWHSSLSPSLILSLPHSLLIQTVEICRDNESLGLRIMGGSERPHHVFRQGDKPGIFILMVSDVSMLLVFRVYREKIAYCCLEFVLESVFHFCDVVFVDR